MRARKSKEILIFDLEGFLDYESTAKLKDTCRQLMNENETDLVIFNIENLRFVGSSGVSQFVKALAHFNGKKSKAKICAASSEFEKLFRALQSSRKPFDIYTDESEAMAAFDEAKDTKPVRKTQ